MQNLQFERATKPVVNLNEGEFFIGKYIGERVVKKDHVNTFTGEVGPLVAFDFESEEEGECFMWANGGLKGAFKLGDVKPGDILKIVHKGLKKVEGKGEVNDYEIFKARSN